AQRVQGRRVDIAIDDVIAANGERVPSADDVRQDYWREVQVVLISPRDTVDSSTPRALIARINQARLGWEAWNLEATEPRPAAFRVGTEDRFTDGFEDETGWIPNPDGNDSATGATWERGTPEATQVLRRVLQAGGAHGGEAAWATGIAATARGNRANLVTGGH